MSRFYMRYPADEPHTYNPLDPDRTKCGLPMAGMKTVTDLQVLVYLRGRHCNICTPNLGRVEPDHSPQRRAA
jgi:hypothetical protein